VGDSISISDRANQKDTTTGDRVYLARRHDGGGASRSGDARRTTGHEHAGLKAPTRINEVEIGISA